MNAWVGRRLTFHQKRKLSFSMCFIANFLGGTESAIILPTVWMYLQKLGVDDEKYMGYVISAFTFSGMLSGLAVGRIVDLTDNVRFVVLSLNLCQVFGQFLYFWGISANSLILARFLCGIGIGINSAFYSEIARGTSKHERSRMITWAFVMRQFSIILAPGYNLVLAKIPPMTFNVGPVQLNLTEESAPGALLCLLWALFELLLFFGYFNMAEEYQKYKEEKRQAKKQRRESKISSNMPAVTVSETTPLIDSTTARQMIRNADTTEEISSTSRPAIMKSSSTKDQGSRKTSETQRVRWVMDVDGSDEDTRSLFTPVEHSVVAAPDSNKNNRSSDPNLPRGTSENSIRTTSTISSSSSLSTNDDEEDDAFAEDTSLIRRYDRSWSGSLHKSAIGSASSATLTWACSVDETSEKGKRRRKSAGKDASDPRRQYSRAPSEEASLLAQMLSGSLTQEGLAVSPESAGADMELYKREFVNPRIIMLMYLMVVGFLAQTMVETIIPPLMQEYFNYTSTENSFIFMAVGGEALLVYAVILNCSRKIDTTSTSASETSVTKTFSMDDNKTVLRRNQGGCRVLTERGVIAFSCCALLVALSGFLVVGAFMEPGKTELLAPFLICCGITFLALPAAMVSCVSLLTICLDQRVQGLGQGMRRFCDYFGNILGPLWGGALVFRPFPLYGGVLALVLVQIILVFCSYRDLDPFAERRRRLSLRTSTNT